MFRMRLERAEVVRPLPRVWSVGPRSRNFTRPGRRQALARPLPAEHHARSRLRLPTTPDLQPVRLPKWARKASSGSVPGFAEFDRVLGGGVVPGSVTLIAGEPGIGKSTLLLQTAGNIARVVAGDSTFRGAGQRSAQQSGRAQATHRTRCRCGATHHQHTPTPCCTFPARNHRRRFVCALPASMRWSRTCYWPPPPTCPQYWGLIEQNKPALAIVDSAQTIVSQEVDGISGGSTQVREVASALIDTAKTLDIPVFLVGHVTKDGSIAGPRTLEHLVDVVCQFEGDSETALRMLRAVKNRFGPDR